MEWAHAFHCHPRQSRPPDREQEPHGRSQLAAVPCANCRIAQGAFVLGQGSVGWLSRTTGSSADYCEHVMSHQRDAEFVSLSRRTRFVF